MNIDWTDRQLLQVEQALLDRQIMLRNRLAGEADDHRAIVTGRALETTTAARLQLQAAAAAQTQPCTV